MATASDKKNAPKKRGRPPKSVINDKPSRDVLERMAPVITPRVNIHEVFVEADSPIARYRERIKEWEARGWRIDSDQVEANKHKVAYAIPSPARRESKGWALDPGPLIPAGKAIDEAMKTAAE